MSKNKLINLFYLGLLLWPMAGRASIVSNGLDAAAKDTGLGNRDIISVTATIVNALLGILGVLFVVLILYGGFQWMTSGGSSEKIGKAKTAITNATIGLAIVLMSYAIANFVVTAITDATTDTGGATSSP